MEKSTKKKIIIITVIDLLFAALFALSVFVITSKEVLIMLEFIALISCGIINVILINDKTLWKHIKFFIPLSIGIAILFKISYILYNIFSSSLSYFFFYLFVYADVKLLIKNIIINIAKPAGIFFIGTLLGIALKKLMNKLKEPQARKELKIRVFVYSIIALLAGGLAFHKYYQYREKYPKPKLIGVEFCATPEEAVRRYAEALIKADRKEALKYVYKPLRDIERWEGHKRRLYEDYTDDELKNRGNELLSGNIDKKWQAKWGGGADWTVIHNINGEIIGGDTHLVNTVSGGWKID